MLISESPGERPTKTETTMYKDDPGCENRNHGGEAWSSSRFRLRAGASDARASHCGCPAGEANAECRRKP